MPSPYSCCDRFRDSPEGVCPVCEALDVIDQERKAQDRAASAAWSCAFVIAALLALAVLLLAWACLTEEVVP